MEEMRADDNLNLSLVLFAEKVSKMASPMFPTPDVHALCHPILLSMDRTVI